MRRNLHKTGIEARLGPQVASRRARKSNAQGTRSAVPQQTGVFVVDLSMHPRSCEQPPELPDDSAISGATTQEVAPTTLLERTLAVPVDPKVTQTALGEADTLDLRIQELSAATASPKSPPTGGLRDPVLDARYHHAYDAAGAAQQELGRGGIGRVLLVFDRTLGRNVAMKELLPELASTDNPIDAATHTQRFLREARITGQLEHPNIVPVYELGREPSGRFYYTMRVIRGRTLASAMREASNLQQRLSLINHFAGLCHAIAYAHSRGVVHRDIKPENVMLGEFGETYVLDWGLANIVEETSPRSLHSAATLSLPPSTSKRPPALTPGTATDFRTQLGTIVGTPQYMSPERLLMPDANCSPRGDVWALGVVLYCILTGKQPFAADTLGELICQIVSTAPARIHEISPLVPKDLAAIAERALAKSPELRYMNAVEMARDITAYQAGEKVGAYEYGSLEQLRRFCRRHRAPLLVAMAALILLCILAVSYYHRVTIARDVAVAAERRATLGEQRAKLNLADVLVERARVEAAQGDPVSATLLASAALELSESPEARGLVVATSNLDRLERVTSSSAIDTCVQAIWNPVLMAYSCTKRTTLEVHYLGKPLPMPVVPISETRSIFSLNAAGWLITEASMPPSIWAPNHDLVSWNTHVEQAKFIAASRDGRYLAALDGAGQLLVFNPPSLQVPTSIRGSSPITAVAFHPIEQLLAYGTFRGQIYLVTWEKPFSPALLGDTHSTVRALAFSPKSHQLASGGSDGSLLIWDTLQRGVRVSPARASSPIATLSFSPDGSNLAVTTHAGVVDVLDGTSYEQSTRYPVDSDGVRQVEFATNDTLVGIGDGRHPFQLYLRKSNPSARFPTRSNVLSLAWSANRRDVLVAGLGERGICHLNLSSAVCGDKLPVRATLVRKVAHSQSQRLYAVGGTGGQVELWDADNKIPRGFVQVPIPEVRDLLFLPNEPVLYVVGSGPSLVRIDTDHMGIKDHQVLTSPAQSVAFWPGRQLLALGQRNGHVQLRSIATGKLEADLALVSGWPIGLAVSERDDWLAVAEDSGRLTFFDLTTLRPKASLTIGAGRLTAFAFSPEHRLIAAAGEEREIRLISTENPHSIVARLVEHLGTVRTLLFDPTAPRLLSAGDDGLVRLWQLDSLRVPAITLRAQIEQKHGLRVQSGRVVRSAEIQ